MLGKWILLFAVPLFFLAGEENGSIEQAIQGLMSQFFEEKDLKTSLVKTSHSLDLPSGPIDYTAVAGSLPCYADDGSIAGEIFFTAYLKDAPEVERPITFLFNGGPGGSSYALHLGGLGPRRILFPEEGLQSSPPYPIIDNPEAIFELSDLVFIDPIDTGYSRSNALENEPLFFSVEGDIFSMAEFIRVFCIHFNKWQSPKYLLGVSYGTSRACGLIEALMEFSGIHVNGVALLGCALEFRTLDSSRDSALADCLSLPTYAATSWFHRRTMQDKTLEEVVDYARRFAMEDYAPAMMQPTRLSPLEQTSFYQGLSDLIGLPAATLRRHAGRIDENTFVSEFYAAERKRIGGIDSRYVGEISTIRGEEGEDPSYLEFRPALLPSFMQYMQDELQLSQPFPRYTPFSAKAFYRWTWATYDGGAYHPPNFMQRLRRGLVHHPSMKIFIGSGYYDIRTPFAAAEHSIERLDLPDRFRSNFQFEYYEAGHGFIFDLPSLQKLKKDLTIFYSK